MEKGQDIERLKDDCGKRALGSVSICVVIGGSKLDDGSVVESPGVLEEAATALARGAAVIPVGSSGYAAKAL